MSQQQFWLVHMGRPGGKPREGSIDYTRELLDRGCVAIGWPGMGDMSSLPDDQDVFRDRFWMVHPDYHSLRGAAQASGMLYRFVHRVRPGDIIVCPTPGGGDPVHIGEVVGDYRYDRGTYGDYHHLRNVKWLVEVPRSELTKAAKNSLTVSRSLMAIHKHEQEFRKFV